MSQLWLCCEGEQRKSGLKSIVMSPDIWFWKEAGCRKDYWTLVGQMKASPKCVRKRKARNQTRDSRCFQKVVAKSDNIKGVDMAKRYCNASTQ